MSTQALSVEQKTVAIIANLAGAYSTIVLPGDANLVDDLGYDSLDLIELALRIEEAFGIEIPDEAAEKWKTVADVVTYTAGLGIR